MNNIDYLDKALEVKIDRPLGSKHPKHGFIYPINYGYVPNTISGDGEELDCYVLGIYEPLETFKGKCIAIIHRLNDNDDKLIIVPENKSFSNNEIRVLTEFQEQYFKSEIIRSSNYLEFSKNIPELSVTNLENSLNFYKTAGFKIDYDRPENKFTFISLGEIQFMLQEISNSNYKITFDIEENWYRQDNKLLGNKEFLIQDPDGYLLRFSEDLEEKKI